MIMVQICINFEDSMLRFDDQLAFVLKYYTPSLSLEMVHETITNDNGTNVSLKFWTLNPIAQTNSQDMKTWKFSFGHSGYVFVKFNNWYWLSVIVRLPIFFMTKQSALPIVKISQ